jgi:hypothetical protein
VLHQLHRAAQPHSESDGRHCSTGRRVKPWPPSYNAHSAPCRRCRVSGGRNGLVSVGRVRHIEPLVVRCGRLPDR